VRLYRYILAEVTGTRYMVQCLGDASQSVYNADCKHCASLPVDKRHLSLVDNAVVEVWSFLKSENSISVRGHQWLACVHCCHVTDITHGCHHCHWTSYLMHLLAIRN
jgi:hypothetical protein